MKLIFAIAALAAATATATAADWTKPGWYQVITGPTGATIFNGPYDTPECASDDYLSRGIICAHLDYWPMCEPVMSVECYEEKVLWSKKVADREQVARVAARTKMATSEWTQSGWYQVGNDVAVGKFIVAGPFKSENDCRETIVPGDDSMVRYACTRFKKKPSCSQAWNDTCPSTDF